MTPERREFFAATKPRPVADGLVARSTRGAIGEHWWSQRFLAVCESYALGTRLTRGKAYARKGQVIRLDVAAGCVSAAVQGSRRTPYAVRIDVPPLVELVWAKTELALTEDAGLCAQLLAGDLPPELEDVVAAAGGQLFPATLRDLTMQCSCPDPAVPCKHLAAAFYLLAERFDDDPFEILRWRGRARDDLLARLRQLRGSAPTSPTEPPADPDRPPAASSSESSFWSFPTLPPLPPADPMPADLVLRQLPAPGPALGGPGFADDLRPLYAALGDDPGPQAGPLAHDD